MTPEEKKLKKEALRWHFWFAVSFSLFLIVPFALSLPLRFLHQVGVNEEVTTAHVDEEGANHHGNAQYHEENEVKEGLAVNLNATPPPFTVGNPIRLDFRVSQKPADTPVSAEILEIAHEKPMHVIGVRSDMEEFRHIHPVPTEEAGVFSIKHKFDKPGTYKFWSEIKKDGINHSFGHPEISVEGSGPAFEKEVSLGKNIIVDEYQVALRLDDIIKAGQETELFFDVHTLDSHEIEYENYLDATMHLTIIKDDWKQFIHTHPEEKDHHASNVFIQEAFANGGGHNTSVGGHGVEFHVTFPETGLYKVFAQFRPSGIGLPEEEALTAGLWIKVSDRPAVSSRWILLFASVAAIAVLSWLVSKYLNVKE